ncbi:MAG TPA: glycosyltransferase family 4 protein [Phycisphaerae bacterium]|nr:glycosyltransferase family 4 protein [Phycisphaerae bacterium]
MTKWLYLSSDLGIPLDGTKGASEHIRAITRALAFAGADVTVLAPRGELPPDHPASRREVAAGIEARVIGDELRRWLDDVDANTGLASEFSQMLYDARLADALAQPDFLPPVDVVVERLSLFATAGRRFAKSCGASYLVEMNAPLAQEAATYRESGLQELARDLEARTLREADLVMTVSDALREYVVDRFHLPAHRVVTVANGVELEMFSASRDAESARRAAGVPREAVVFGFVGTLRPWHGVDVLMEAFAKVCVAMPNAHLLIVGDGRKVERYRARAGELQIGDAVTFYGSARHEEVPSLLAAMDVALAPYLPQPTFYFSPLKLYEYLAAGLCVIASRAGQIAELIRHDHNGLLVTPGDINDLARAMLRAGQSPELRKRLQLHAKSSVSTRGWSQVAATIIELANTVRRALPCRIQEHAHVS